MNGREHRHLHFQMWMQHRQPAKLCVQAKPLEVCKQTGIYVCMIQELWVEVMCCQYFNKIPFKPPSPLNLC